MLLFVALSPPSLSAVCLKSCGRVVRDVTLKRNIGNARMRELPPTILKDILGGSGNIAKGVDAVSFGRDARKNAEAQKSKICLEPPCLRKELLCNVSEPVRDCCHKVSVVGMGMVGIAITNALLFQRVTSQIALVDAFPKKLEGEGLDFSHGLPLLGDLRVDFDTDFCITRESKVVILAAGARQEKGESRLDLTKRNADIFKQIVPTLVGFSPNAIFLIVANPVDILSWITWKVSGFPFYRVIGAGTHLDSSRFRYLIAQRLGIAPGSVNACIVGEHGDSQVALWSGVSVAGIQFRDIIPNIGLETDEEKWYEIAREVVRAGSTVRCLKGYTNTAIGVITADIVRAILDNTQSVKPLSTMIQGHHDVCHEMYLSLPCVVGEHGITKIVRQRMTEYERKLFQTSAKVVFNHQKDVKLGG